MRRRIRDRAYASTRRDSLSSEKNLKLIKFRHAGRIDYGQLSPEGLITVLKHSPFEEPVAATSKILRLMDVETMVPTVDHPRVFGVGFNYRSHILETGRELPEIPSIFMKPDTALIAHGGQIVHPTSSEVVHYEAELVAVIGRRAHRVKRSQALSHVLGYTCGNDVSERVIQRKEMAMGLMTIGKGFDTFAPIGPWIETDVDPSRLTMRGFLNGKLVQECETSDLLFGVDALVEYLSASITLMPGDLIMTGTPAGIGALRPGDVFEVEIDGVGALRNAVVAEPGTN
jgi:2-keto-4-pentenoate hydratase/2-oxohepta-3-ene-1,7-dioic acid hydratase in catechol pathway